MIGMEVPYQSASTEEKLNYVETLAEFHLELDKAAGNKRLFDKGAKSFPDPLRSTNSTSGAKNPVSAAEVPT